MHPGKFFIIMNPVNMETFLYFPQEPLRFPVTARMLQYLSLQKRFRHLSKEEIKEIQKQVNESYKKLENLEKSGDIF